MKRNSWKNTYAVSVSVSNITNSLDPQPTKGKDTCYGRPVNSIDASA